jgi:phage gp46-like protein
MNAPKHDVFLSYSRKDKATMLRLRDALKGAGLAVWIDDESLEPGSPIWQQSIEDAIKESRSMVVLLSPAAKASKWVTIEIAVAERRGVRIFPLLLSGDEDSAVPFALATTHFVDARQSRAQVVEQRLLPALLRYLGRAQAAPGAEPAFVPLTPPDLMTTLTPYGLRAPSPQRSSGAHNPMRLRGSQVQAIQDALLDAACAERPTNEQLQQLRGRAQAEQWFAPDALAEQPTGSRTAALKRRALEEQLAVLGEQYAAANRQLNSMLSDADAVKLRLQIADLERKMAAVEQQLDQIKGS